jgi:hypothetical protein
MTEPVRQPQKAQADDRHCDVRVEDDPSIPRCEVMNHDYLMRAAGGGSEEEYRGSNHRGGAQAEASTACEKADHYVAQAGHPNLRLKRARFPTDELGGHVAKKDMDDEVVA